MATEIHRVAQLTAFAMKNTYGCDGISTRQHNEPAGNQDMWHYHLHIYPRYENDNLYLTKGCYTEPRARHFYADKLRLWIQANIKCLHIHAFQYDNIQEIERHILFRNYLRQNPEISQEYGELKSK